MLAKSLAPSIHGHEYIKKATLGSPMSSTLTSPLSLVPLGRFFSTPPRSIHSRAFLMYSCPWMEGARDLANISKTSPFCLENFLHFCTSSPVMLGVTSLDMRVIWLVMRMVLKVPLVKPPCLPGRHL